MNETVELSPEKVICRTGLHWAMLLGPALFIFLGALILNPKGPQAMVLIAFGSVWGLVSAISLRQSYITLTTDRLLLQVGFPLKKAYSLSLDEITLIHYYQPTLGAILNFGKIILVHGTKQKDSFRFVSRPAVLVKEVQEAIAFRSQKSDSPEDGFNVIREALK
jgi:hypothetical protein